MSAIAKKFDMVLRSGITSSFSPGQGVSAKVPGRDSQVLQPIGEIVEGADDDVDHFAFSLDVAGGYPGVGPAGHAVTPLPGMLMNDQVAGPRFIFERNERDERNHVA